MKFLIKFYYIYNQWMWREIHNARTNFIFYIPFDDFIYINRKRLFTNYSFFIHQQQQHWTKSEKWHPIVAWGLLFDVSVLHFVVAMYLFTIFSSTFFSSFDSKRILVMFDRSSSQHVNTLLHHQLCIILMPVQISFLSLYYPVFISNGVVIDIFTVTERCWQWCRRRVRGSIRIVNIVGIINIIHHHTG